MPSCDAETVDAAMLFSSHPLVGRDEEQRRLKNALNTVLAFKTTVLTLIQGQSGTGKSALAHTLKAANHSSRQSHFFLSGKFDLFNAQEPYSGIKIAMTELCYQILDLPRTKGERSFFELQQSLSKGLKQSELRALSKVVPGILDVLAVENKNETNDNNHTNRELDSRSLKKQSSFESLASSVAHSIAGDKTNIDRDQSFGYRESSERQKYALLHFMQIVCNYCPLVAVMDDIQWADQASLDLLQLWLLDSKNSSLMVVGCFRDDAVDDEHPLTKTISALEESKQERSLEITRIYIKNLERGQVVDLLMILLECHQRERVESLGSIIHTKTNGNAFFVQHFLWSLVAHNLLTQDPNSARWKWKEEAISLKFLNETSATELVEQKLYRVHAAKQILPIAACIGATFSSSTLSKIMRGLSIHSDHSAFFTSTFAMKNYTLNDATINDMLRQCEKGGLIERGNGQLRKEKRGKLFSFSHDKIQELSLSLISKDRIAELKYRVGEVLLSSVPSDDNTDDSVFVVVNLLNSRLDLVPSSGRGDRRMKVIQANHKAGRHAVSCSAFCPALTYFKTAISLLPEDHWKVHFKLSLEIYSSAAECAYMLSDIEQVRHFSSVVLKLDRPVLDKIRVYHVLIEATVVNADPNEDRDPIDLCLSLLKQLDCKIPKPHAWRKVPMLSGILKYRRLAHRWTKKTVDNLKIVVDEKEAAITKTLDKLFLAAYILKPDLLPHVILKSADRALSHGLSPFSPPAFAFLGIIVGFVLGDHEASRHLGQAALDMHRMMGNTQSLSRTIAYTYGGCFHSSQPFRTLHDDLMAGYQHGLSSGDVENAMWNIYRFLQFKFCTGCPLPLLGEELSTYSEMMKDFRQNMQLELTMVLWQCVLNIRGDSEHHTALIGTAYDETAPRSSQESENILKFAVPMCKLTAATYNGDFESGAKIAIATHEERLKKLVGSPGLVMSLFWGGLCCYAAAATKTANRQYGVVANKSRKKLKEWYKQGNPNCFPYMKFLDAEHKNLRAMHKEATALYEELLQ